MVGCGSTPPEDRYYSLVLEAADDGVIEQTEPADLTVNLSRIDVPVFLNSRAMALQTGANEVEIAQHHFWAEPLDEAIAKVLVRDISQTSSRIDIARDGRREANCELRVEFDRFHATDDGRVLASGRYWVSSASGSAKSEFDVSQRLGSSGYTSAVSTLRRSLGTLAADIAGEIEAAEHCQPAGLAE